MSGPREFWIVDRPDGNGTHVFHSESVAKGYCEDNDISNGSDHVIEYSAYEALKAQLAEVTRERDAQRQIERDLLASNKSERAKAERYRAIIAQIAKVDMPSASDKTAWIVMLESICALARKALTEAEGE